MADIQFEDNSARVIDALDDACIAWLYEAAGEIEAQTKRNTRVDSGQLKSSWTYVVDESSQEATVGSPLENAIWEEFGTGQYALNGNGRKKPWKYKDRKGNWHTTIGKKPKRMLFTAFNGLKSKLQTALENKLKGLN